MKKNINHQRKNNITYLKKYGGNDNKPKTSIDRSAKKATDNFVNGIIDLDYENENYSEFCRVTPISEGVYLKDLFNNIEMCEAFLISTKGIVSFLTELFKEAVSSNNVSKLREYLEQRCSSSEITNSSQDNSPQKKSLLRIIDRVINKTKLKNTLSKNSQKNKIYTEMENNLNTSDEASDIYRNIFAIYFGLVSSTPEKCEHSKKIIRLFFLLKSLVKNQKNIKTQYFIKSNENQIEKNPLSLLLYVIYDKLISLIINFLPQDTQQSTQPDIDMVKHYGGGVFDFLKPKYKLIHLDLNKYKNDIINYTAELENEKIPFFEINQKNKARVIINIGLYGLFSLVVSVGIIGAKILPIPSYFTGILNKVLDYTLEKTTNKLKTLIYRKHINPKRPPIKNSDIINNDTHNSFRIIDNTIQQILEHIPLNIRALLFMISALSRFPNINTDDYPIYIKNKYNYGEGDLIFNKSIYSDVKDSLPTLEEIFTKNKIKINPDKTLGEVLNTHFFTNLSFIQKCIPWFNNNSIQNCDNTNDYKLYKTYTNLKQEILPSTYFGENINFNDIFNKLNNHNTSHIDIILREIQILITRIYQSTDTESLTDNEKTRLELTFNLINLLIDEIRLLSKIYVLLINDYINTNKKITYKKYFKNNYLLTNNQYYIFLFHYLYDNKIVINNYKHKFNEIENILNNNKEKVNSVIENIYNIFFRYKIIEPINVVLTETDSLFFESEKVKANRQQNINVHQYHQKSIKKPQPVLERPPKTQKYRTLTINQYPQPIKSKMTYQPPIKSRYQTKKKNWREKLKFWK